MTTTRRVMPRQRPGMSKQDVGTPDDLLQAVRHRLGIKRFDVDLAAHQRNTVCNEWYGPRSPLGDDFRDSLASHVRWNYGPGWSWLNPPYSDIRSWVRKAEREAHRYGARVAMLVPLSTCEWWADHVDNVAVVFLLCGRVTFKGQTKPYPKDCAILLFGSGMPAGYHLWKWKGKRSCRTTH